MRLTYARRERAPVELILGRKSRVLKRRLRKFVRDVAKEAHTIAVFFCPVDTGFMQRHLRLAFTPAGFGFDLGWRANDFRSAGKVFYPPFVVEGTSRQAPQDPLRPAFQMTRQRLLTGCVLIFRTWAKEAA